MCLCVFVHDNYALKIAFAHVLHCSLPFVKAVVFFYLKNRPILVHYSTGWMFRWGTKLNFNQYVVIVDKFSRTVQFVIISRYLRRNLHEIVLDVI